MPNEHWTDYPDMEWWKFKPSSILLSREFRLMPYTARGPAFWIIVGLMSQEDLPGVATYSDDQLADWARMSIDDWRHEKLAALQAFVMYADDTIHSPYVRALYRNRCEDEYTYFKNGMMGPFKRAMKHQTKKSKVIQEPEIPPYLDPYSRWKKLPPMRADLYIRQRGDEGGLWGGSEPGVIPPWGIRREEDKSRKTLINQATNPAALGDGGAVAVENGSPKGFFGKLAKQTKKQAEAGR